MAPPLLPSPCPFFPLGNSLQDPGSHLLSPLLPTCSSAPLPSSHVTRVIWRVSYPWCHPSHSYPPRCFPHNFPKHSLVLPPPASSALLLQSFHFSAQSKDELNPETPEIGLGGPGGLPDGWPCRAASTPAAPFPAALCHLPLRKWLVLSEAFLYSCVTPCLGAPMARFACVSSCTNGLSFNCWFL